MSISKKKILCLTQADESKRMWVKRYTRGPRRWRLYALNAVVRVMGLPALVAPEGRSGAAVREIEQRRLTDLAAKGVRVPEVLATGANELLLSDLGITLALRLRKASPEQAQKLLQRSVTAIAQAHRHGAYLGQPQARNIAVDDRDQIGFLDFEEDPGEVMSLVLAQCRDWLIFASGTVRHLPFRDQRFVAALAAGLEQANPAVIAALRESLDRLGPVRAICSVLGRRAGGIVAAIDGLRGATLETRPF